MKHISYPKHRTNLLAGLTLIFLFKRMLCIGYFKCNTVSLSKKEGKLGAKREKKSIFKFLQLVQYTGVCQWTAAISADWGTVESMSWELQLYFLWISMNALLFHVTLTFGKMAWYLGNKSTRKLQAACTSDITYFIYESRKYTFFFLLNRDTWKCQGHLNAPQYKKRSLFERHGLLGEVSIRWLRQ